MSSPTVTLEGTLQPDGVTLQLDRKVAIPPGRVTVTVCITAPRSGPTMVEVLDRIHDDQRRRGRPPMTEEEMVADLASLRADDEYEERWRQIWAQSAPAGGGEGTP